MASDLELIQERLVEDRRNFLVNALDPNRAPRLSPALRRCRNLLLDGKWHDWTEVIAEMLRASDLAVKTVDTQLRNAISAGVVERRGDYARYYDRTKRKQMYHDTRQVRLIEWPTESPSN